MPPSETLATVAPAAPSSAPPPALPRSKNRGDRAWAALLSALGGGVLVVAGAIVLSLAHVAAPAVRPSRVHEFIASSDWDPVRESFGALPFIYGTLVTSALGLLFALPVAIGLALFLTEMAPARLRSLVSFLIELLAGIPSVVYGLWGLFVIVPGIRAIHGGAGQSYLAAGLVLSVMILPTITSITIEVLRTVPSALREAALALGATRWEAIRLTILPYARAGILGATILGLGRALGETMAVTMVIGNSPTISASLFAPGYSLPAVIANEFAEASGDVHTASLAALGLLLFGVTLILNSFARLLVRMARRGPARAVVA